jgi:hypothetical protein
MSDTNDDDDLAGLEPVLLPEAVAEFLQIDPRYLIKLMREGKFPGFKVAGTWRIRKADLRAVMRGTWHPEGWVASADDPETT